MYEVRHDDNQQGLPVEIAQRILVNHWGTLLSSRPIRLFGAPGRRKVKNVSCIYARDAVYYSGRRDKAMGISKQAKPQRSGENVKFERIRRITGYLVGTTDRWNNAKKAELGDRVKHETKN